MPAANSAACHAYARLQSHVADCHAGIEPSDLSCHHCADLYAQWTATPALVLGTPVR
jgi:hypothetical protein